MDDPPMNRTIRAVAVGLSLLALSGCKFVKTAATPTGAPADPDDAKIADVVASTYEARLLPLIASEATDAATLLPAIAAGIDEAGKDHGHRGGGYTVFE